MDKYPWINYGLNLKKLSLKTWIQLGQCYHMCEQISNVPLKPTLQKELHKIYLAKGVRATTAIEGNTLTEEEVRLQIEKKLKLPPSKRYLGQEIKNILTLCNQISGEIKKGIKITISIEALKDYNKTILTNVPISTHVIPGKFRTYPIGVGSYKAPEHTYVAELLKKLCDWLNSSFFEISEDLQIVNSIVKAIIAHLYIEWIHPFGDGNGRLGRILEFKILLGSGVPSPAAHLLSNHYNSTRSEYYRQLDIASKKNSITEFIEYAVQGFVDGLEEQLRYINSQIIGISWENFIYEKFKHYEGNEPTMKRRRTLILALSHKREAVLKDNIVLLNRNMMDTYRELVPKTLDRDLIELENMGLVERTDKGYKANIEKILGFLPFRSS